MKIHFIAIGGSAMHNLALALKDKGYEISGSDDEIFEPSRTRLQKAGLLPPETGWHPDRITAGIDAVVLGMHAKADNPELLRAREKGIKIYSYPEFIYEQAKEKTRVVIAGSHGKTTITAMVLHAMHYHGLSCDFLVGAGLEGFDNMVHLTGENEFILIEGDEYLSSALDPQPKFLWYKPNIALISGIAWDHMNVFPDPEDYREQFRKFVGQMESGGALVYFEEDGELRSIVEEHSSEVKLFPYRTPEYEATEEGCVLRTDEGGLPLHIFGRHNMQNIEGARWISQHMGVTAEMFYEAIADFKGASRRMEPLVKQNGRKAIFDFAHAPSKVRATVGAVRERYPDHHITACLELHTYSSLNPAFMKNYRGSMEPADSALVYFNPEAVALKRLPDLSSDDVSRAFGGGIEVFSDVKGLIARSMKDRAEKAVLLFMSSGNFDGTDTNAWAREWVES